MKLLALSKLLTMCVTCYSPHPLGTGGTDTLEDGDGVRSGIMGFGNPSRLLCWNKLPLVPGYKRIGWNWDGKLLNLGPYFDKRYDK